MKTWEDRIKSLSDDELLQLKHSIVKEYYGMPLLPKEQRDRYAALTFAEVRRRGILKRKEM